MAQCPLEGRVRKAVKKIRTTITSCDSMDLILPQKAIDQWQLVAFGSMHGGSVKLVCPVSMHSTVFHRVVELTSQNFCKNIKHPHVHYQVRIFKLMI
ncbi:hypothetical protein NC651_011686 [Populus alba x Populus x berolinensis]|nr:hypothetical protein NC651_011686 [Populus alba x Populus x berolinensis]